MKMDRRILKGGEYLVTDVACEEVFTPEEFTDEQKQIGETTEQFVTNEILPHLEEIDNQARRCGAIVRSLLQFSRDGVSVREDHDLSEVVEQCRDLTLSYAASRGVEIHLSVASSPLPVHIDSIEISRRISQ